MLKRGKLKLANMGLNLGKPMSGIQDTGVVTEVLGTFRGSLAEFLRKPVPTPNSENIFSGMKVE